MALLRYNCLVCGKEGYVKPSHAERGAGKYCSKACVGKSQQKRVWLMCEVCGVPFPVPQCRSKTAKTCSERCKGIAQTFRQLGADNPAFKGGKVNRICDWCGGSFEAHNSEIRRGGGQYCTPECGHRAQRGKYAGPNSPGWKGGVTPQTVLERQSARYKEWRESVFTRDNWTCQDCGERGGTLHAHHVFSWAEFPEHRFEPYNGITLCFECHKKQHPENHLVKSWKRGPGAKVLEAKQDAAGDSGNTRL